MLRSFIGQPSSASGTQDLTSTLFPLLGWAQLMKVQRWVSIQPSWCSPQWDGPRSGRNPLQLSLTRAIYPGRVRNIGRLGSQLWPCLEFPEPQFPHLYDGPGRDGRPHSGNQALCHTSLSRRWSGGGGWGWSRLPGKPSLPAPTTQHGQRSTTCCRYLAGDRLLEGGGGLWAWGLSAPWLVCSAPRRPLWPLNFWLQLNTAHRQAQTLRAFSSGWRQCQVRSWPATWQDWGWQTGVPSLTISASKSQTSRTEKRGGMELSGGGHLYSLTCTRIHHSDQ